MSDWTVDTLKELLETRLGALDKALSLQAIENLRRLDALNGEQGRIAKSQETYVNREVFDKVQDADREWKARADARMNENAGQRKGAWLVLAVAASALSAAATAVGMYIALRGTG